MFLDDELYQIMLAVSPSKERRFRKATYKMNSLILNKIIEIAELPDEKVIAALKRINNSYKLFVARMKSEGKNWFKETGLIDYLKAMKKQNC